MFNEMAIEQPIRILGAGPSGLAAAINLAKAGYKVEVYERNKDCGQRFGGDLQGLENWSEEINVLEDLKQMSIHANFYNKPFTKITVSNGKESKGISSEEPIFYIVKRGNMAGSLDQGLKEQAIEAGVRIKFNSSLPAGQADIVATGPIMNQLAGIDKGIVFETGTEDMAAVIINQKAAYKGYSYLLVTDGYGCMCAVVFGKLNKVNECFEETKKFFSGLYNIEIRNCRGVGGVGSFSTHNMFKANSQLFVGEAAGIQDVLAGFGIRSAITSGYLAARSIIDGTDYVEAAKKEFNTKIRTSLVNRFLFEIIISNDALVRYTMKNLFVDNPLPKFRRVYNSKLLRMAMFPLARFYMQKVHRNLKL
ncbi:NAD(P)/FAD-dependent oxidoreductase [Candidatus Woesearchaeota archaeon]|nr:NAD(P)/FAD-dependent oxidoreductase [Candidatus Woesearchaeota archaeon]